LSSKGLPRVSAARVGTCPLRLGTILATFAVCVVGEIDSTVGAAFSAILAVSLARRSLVRSLLVVELYIPAPA